MGKSTEVATKSKRGREHQSPLTAEISTNVASKPKRAKKKTSKKAEKDAEEERRLTNLLFGGADASVPEELVEKPQRRKEKKQRNKNSVPADNEDPSDAIDTVQLFSIDRTGEDVEEETNTEDLNVSADVSANTNMQSAWPDDDDNDDDNDDDDSSAGSQDDDLKPAWIDEDDEHVTVDLLNTDRLRKLRKTRDEKVARALSGSEFSSRLRQRYRETAQETAHTEWSRLDNAISSNRDDDEEEDEEQLGLSSQPLLSSSSRMELPPNLLSTVRCPDANQEEYNDAVVQAVSFHPGSDPDRPLLVTGGFDKTLRFFQVGSEKSLKIHGIHFPKLPIFSASFLGDSGNVVVSGRRPFFYIYDSVAGKMNLIPRIAGRAERSLEKCVASPDGKMLAFCGNDGYVILVDTHTRHWIDSLKMNGNVRALTFTPDAKYILGSGSDGDVYRWDVHSRRCVERFHNEDGSVTCSLAASSRHLAVGGQSGVVNMYHDHVSSTFSQSLAPSSHRDPLKSIMNLQTSADMVNFNHDGQILALSSRREKQGLKLLHVPSASVFSNWPTSNSPLGYVWTHSFSPQSKFLAVGNDKGKCLLYKLNHYNQ